MIRIVLLLFDGGVHMVFVRFGSNVEGFVLAEMAFMELGMYSQLPELSFVCSMS